jgi:DNA invertase Pin-like site-specific DNA recombinase
MSCRVVNMPAKTKAFGYLRVSGKGQLEGDGFTRQELAINRFAKSGGFEVVEWFKDEGVSGTTELENRAGLAALLDRVESNGVRVVIVERADRLARDTVVSEVIIREFRAAGVRVLSADGVDLTEGDDQNPTAKLIRQILAAVAEFDRCVTVLKLSAARARVRAREGRCEGRKPYGHTPTEAVILERILGMRRAVKGSERMSFAKIAETLNSEGVPSRTGKAWAPGVVYNIIKAHAPQLAKALER